MARIKLKTDEYTELTNSSSTSITVQNVIDKMILLELKTEHTTPTTGGFELQPGDIWKVNKEEHAYIYDIATGTDTEVQVAVNG